MDAVIASLLSFLVQGIPYLGLGLLSYFIWWLKNRNKREEIQNQAQAILNTQFVALSQKMDRAEQKLIDAERSRAEERGRNNAIIQFNEATIEDLSKRLRDLEQEFAVVKSERDSLRQQLAGKSDELRHVLEEMQTKIDDAISRIRMEYDLKIAQITEERNSLLSRLSEKEARLEMLQHQIDNTPVSNPS